MITLIRCSTGEDWHLLMYDLSYRGEDCVEGVSCGSPFGFVFMIIFILMMSFVMLNLFILILIK